MQDYDFLNEDMSKKDKPSKLTQFKIGGFKAFKEMQTIPIKPITIIVGPNSSGKSSVLSGLVYAIEGQSSQKIDFKDDKSYRNVFCNEIKFGFKYENNNEIEFNIHDNKQKNKFENKNIKILVEDEMLSISRNEISKLFGDAIKKVYDNTLIPDDLFPINTLIDYIHIILCKCRIKINDSDMFEYIDYTHDVIKLFQNNELLVESNGINQFSKLVENCTIEGQINDEEYSENHKYISYFDESMFYNEFNNHIHNLDESIRYGKSNDERSIDAVSIINFIDCHENLFRKYANKRHLKLVVMIGHMALNDINHQFKSIIKNIKRENNGSVLYLSSKRKSIGEKYNDLISWENEWNKHINNKDTITTINDWLGDGKLNTTYKIINPEKYYKESDVIKIINGECTIDEIEGEVARKLKIHDFRINKDLNFDQVGFGLSKIIPVIAGAATKLENYNLILIEEPEMHLHPALQASLGDLFIDSIIKFPNKCFLIETHSEYMLLRMLSRLKENKSNFTLHDIVILYVNPIDDGAVVTELRLDSNGRFIDPWPTGFFDARISKEKLR